MRKIRCHVLLRDDQANLLKNTQNASAFVRQAIDCYVELYPDLGKAEKTIISYNALNELEGAITEQQNKVKQAQEKHRPIQEKLERARKNVETFTQINEGKYTVEPSTQTNLFNIVVESGEKSTIRADSIEQAREMVEERKTNALDKVKATMKVVEEEARLHEAFLEAHHDKLKILTQQRDELKKSIA